VTDAQRDAQPDGQSGPASWADRAAAAERAVRKRSVRRLWAIPGTALGVNSCPPSVVHRLFLGWNYWWQAHLLDCLLDAEIRDPQADRRLLIGRLIHGIRARNLGRWSNRYYDDMAWLALAFERADRRLGTDHGAAISRLTAQILGAWSDALGGGIPWRRGDEFKNTPANGPAAILLARTGHLDRATATVDWIDLALRDPETGLIWDGLRPGLVEKVIYPYGQGVVLGAELEVAARAGRPRDRVHRLVAAVDRHLAADRVLTGGAGGDSGLFSGILARYLALVAADLAGSDPADVTTRAIARRLVLTSAEVAWSNVAFHDGMPLFGPDWSRPARPPSDAPAGRAPERDLSVQLSGWMLLEAAHSLRAKPGGAG
jgi:predicted alpha-1,6-mannanase (GH76 family)